MCDCGHSVHEATEEQTGRDTPDSGKGGWRRRDMLRASAIGGGALLGSGLAAPSALAAPAARPTAGTSAQRGLELILLGTAAGPGLDTERACMSSALVVDGAVYLVDAGLGAARQYAAAGLERDALRRMFITHLHSDHLMAYYDFFITSVTGQAPPPVTAYGPGSAGALPHDVPGSTPGTVAPQDPVPGLLRHTEDCHAAFAYSSNVFMRDMGAPDPRDLVDVREIALPEVGASALGDPAPRMRPFRVMEDDRVKVTATLVPHGPVFPSFAFRFETDHGSVTFSGDTRRTPNLVDLARDTDVLVHEAIGDSAMAANTLWSQHMRASHTPLSQVGGVATDADARRVVLSHIFQNVGEPIVDAQWRNTVRRTYDGPVTVGADLMRFTLGGK